MGKIGIAESKPFVADVTVLPTGPDSFATDNAARAQVDAIVWPQVCCCCGGTASLDSIAIYARVTFGGSNAIIKIPYCRRCQLHYRSAVQRGWEPLRGSRRLASRFSPLC